MRRAFGDFELSLSTLELRRGRVPVKLQAQAARILALLVERAGELVSREEIIARVWCDVTVDYDQGIHNAIRQLRIVLGDSARDPRWIETVPKLGYRFIAPVRSIELSASPPASRRWRTVWTVLVVAGLAAVVQTSQPETARRRVDPQAMNEYLRARYLLVRQTPDAAARASALLQSALAREPDFAAALVALAEAQLSSPATEVTRRAARQAIDRALRLDPGDAYAHLLRFRIALTQEWDWALARRHIETALRLAPNDPRNHLGHAVYLSTLEHHDEALREVEEALRLEPVSAALYGDIAFLHFLAGRYSEARTSAELLLELEPENQTARSMRVECMLESGEWDAARDAAIANYEHATLDADARAALDALRRSSGAGVKSAWLALAAARWEHRPDSNVRDVVMATLHARRGARDAAMRDLERAVARGSSYAPFLAVDPHFAPLHDDPRFRRLIGSIGAGYGRKTEET